MRVVVCQPARLSGTVAVPGDKSVSHRALLFNAVANGTARVANLGPGDDVRSTMRCLRAMGVNLLRNEQDGTVTVQGVGIDGLHEPADVLNCGNSGTTTRLLMGVLAGQRFLSILTGDRSLRSRPMGRVITPLRQMGAAVYGRQGDTLAPLVIRGRPLHGIAYSLPVASAQLKSALLLAGLYAQGETVIRSPAASRDHTERMLRAMGVTVIEDGLTVLVRPSPLTAMDVTVPGDLSSAAFWLVAGACHPHAEVRVENVGVNPSRTGVLDVLEAMGAQVRHERPRQEGGEPVADLVMRSGALRATEIGGDLIPRVIDELPVLAVAACYAQGTTVIRDAEELRVKESDRIKTTVTELARLGAHVEERPDGMVVYGPCPLRGARCRTYDDHRLAMALAVAGLAAEGETTIEGAESASVSYPAFWDHLRLLTGE